MSKPASRVIGIIRISEQSEFGVDLSLALDDSTLGSLLAGLVGKQAMELGRRRHPRWEPVAPSFAKGTARRAVRANLNRLREDLQAEYLELAAH